MTMQFFYLFFILNFYSITIIVKTSYIFCSETTNHEENVLKLELLKEQHQSMIDDVVSGMVLKIAQKIINEMIIERKQKLQYNFDCFQEKKLKIYLMRYFLLTLRFARIVIK